MINPNSTLIFISDNQSDIHKARQWSNEHNYNIKTFTSLQWQNGLSNPAFRSRFLSTPNHLNMGQVVPFPDGHSRQSEMTTTSTIKDVEKVAIQEAIYLFKGNLTKTAASLGIGRATLYRKVKLYNIDLSRPRSRRKVLKVA